jgi:dinuclear metal center YbgI/SA1388 family protein
MTVNELEQYIGELLDVGRFQDYAPNGLQVEGRPEIKSIATAVSASLNVIEQCIDKGVDALLVHHGYFWKGESSSIRGIKKNRLAALIKADINLLAYHLPLDAYLPWGNNASIAQKLGANVTNVLPWNRQDNLLWIGELPTPEAPLNFLAHLKKLYGPQAVHVDVPARTIKSIAWCSGGAQDVMEEAIQYPIDAFITGEFSERTYYLAKESNVHFYAIGHYASEKEGILHLGQHLSNKFGFQHVFIDEPNPF